MATDNSGVGIIKILKGETTMKIVAGIMDFIAEIFVLENDNPMVAFFKKMAEAFRNFNF